MVDDPGGGVTVVVVEVVGAAVSGAVVVRVGIGSEEAERGIVVVVGAVDVVDGEILVLGVVFVGDSGVDDGVATGVVGALLEDCDVVDGDEVSAVVMAVVSGWVVVSSVSARA